MLEARRRRVRAIDHHALKSPLTTCLADPNAPKRGLSAYMFFANEQRDNVRAENPGISFGMFPYLLTCRTPTDGFARYPGQVGKVLGERWKALDTKQRGPYEAKAKADKERYESEKQSYNVSVIASPPNSSF